MQESVPQFETDDHWRLLAKLIDLFFKRITKDVPTVWIPNTEHSDPAKLASSLLHGLQSSHIFNRPTNLFLGSDLQDIPIDGATFFVPSWKMRRDMRPEPYELEIMRCRPTGQDSLLGTIIPSTTLTSRSALKVRETLAASWKPVLVIHSTVTLPGLGLVFHVTIPFFADRNTSIDQLYMFRVPPEAESAAVLREFNRIIEGKSQSSRYGYTSILKTYDGEALTFGRHDPEVLNLKREVANLGPNIDIGEMFSRGPNLVRSKDATWREEEIYSEGPRIITGHDIARYGAIGLPETQRKSSEVASEHQLKVGDLLLPRIFSSRRKSLAVVEVTEDLLPAVALQSVLVLRPNPEFDERDHIFVKYYLRSSIAYEIIKSTANVSPTGSDVRLDWSELRKVLLPRPDEALKAALMELDDAARQFDEWRSQAETVLQSSFSETSSKDIRRLIVGQGRELRLRSQAASLIGDSAYTIRTRYPYPIAYRWRRVEAATSAGDYRGAYEEILDSAEILLCYLAQSVLALAQNSQLELGFKQNLRNRLANGRGGLTLGDWIAILAEVRDGKIFRRLPDEHPLSDFRATLTDAAFERARDRLYKRRNDRAHLRGVDGPELPDAVTEILDDLTQLMTGAKFLTDLKLVHVTGVHWDSMRSQGSITHRELMGDHPVVPTKILQHDKSDIEVGSLYLQDRQGGFYLLRPYLTGRHCPKCHLWSTFHIDSATSKIITLKSLEHSHTLVDPSINAALEYVGIL